MILINILFEFNGFSKHACLSFYEYVPDIF